MAARARRRCSASAPGDVNVKAKTNEGMGFIGRGEGHGRHRRGDAGGDADRRPPGLARLPAAGRVYAVLAVLAFLENIVPTVPADVAVALGAFLSHRGTTTAARRLPRRVVVQHCRRDAACMRWCAGPAGASSTSPTGAPPAGARVARGDRARLPPPRHRRPVRRAASSPASARWCRPSPACSGSRAWRVVPADRASPPASGTAASPGSAPPSAASSDRVRSSSPA